MELCAMTVGIKICGLTDLAEALACAGAGADAIGFVFYPPSPRNISPEDAAEIISSLPSKVVPVGVFVDMPTDKIIEVAKASGIRTVQLHGDDGCIDSLQAEQLRVIKVLKRSGRTNNRIARRFNFFSARI